MITSNNIIKISIIYNNDILENCNFLFESNYTQNFEIINNAFTYIIDFTIFIIQIYNITITPIRLSHKVKLNTFFEYK